MAITGDQLTISIASGNLEGTIVRTVLVTDQIANTITPKVLIDIENAINAGSNAWGSITGDISTQTDLQTEFATKEDVANKTTDGTLSADSDILYPSEQAVKTYVDAHSTAGTQITPDNAIAGSFTGDTFSVPFTTSGLNRIIFFGFTLIGQVNSLDINNVRYNGILMTLVNSQVDTIGNEISFLYMLTNPPLGTSNITVAIGNPPQTIDYVASSYNGAIPAQPQTSNINYGHLVNTLATTLTTAYDNCWTVAYAHSNGAASLSAGAGTTMRVNSENPWGFFDSNGKITPPGPTSLIVNASDDLNNITVCMAAIAPFGSVGVFQIGAVQFIGASAPGRPPILVSGNLDGGTIFSFDNQPDLTQCLNINATDVGGFITINGSDHLDQPISEDIDMTSTTGAQTTRAFKTVLQINTNNVPGVTFSVNTSEILGLDRCFVTQPIRARSGWLSNGVFGTGINNLPTINSTEVSLNTWHWESFPTSTDFTAYFYFFDIFDHTF